MEKGCYSAGPLSIVLILYIYRERGGTTLEHAAGRRARTPRFRKSEDINGCVWNPPNIKVAQQQREGAKSLFPPDSRGLCVWWMNSCRFYSTIQGACRFRAKPLWIITEAESKKSDIHFKILSSLPSSAFGWNDGKNKEKRPEIRWLASTHKIYCNAQISVKTKGPKSNINGENLTGAHNEDKVGAVPSPLYYASSPSLWTLHRVLLIDHQRPPHQLWCALKLTSRKSLSLFNERQHSVTADGRTSAFFHPTQWTTNRGLLFQLSSQLSRLRLINRINNSKCQAITFIHQIYNPV